MGCRASRSTEQPTALLLTPEVQEGSTKNAIPAQQSVRNDAEHTVSAQSQTVESSAECTAPAPQAVEQLNTDKFFMKVMNESEGGDTKFASPLHNDSLVVVNNDVPLKESAEAPKRIVSAVPPRMRQDEISLRAHFLGQGRKGFLLPEGKGYTREAREGCWPLIYLHEASGIKVWGAALDLATPSALKRDLRVLFLYMEETIFNQMLDALRCTRSVWSMLARKGVEAPNGAGLYTSNREPSCLSPHDLFAMGLSTGPVEQLLRHETQFSHFCVPVIAPSSACHDVGPESSMTQSGNWDLFVDVCVVKMKVHEADSNVQAAEEVRLREDTGRLTQDFGRDHPLTLSATNALALRMKVRGNATEAEPLYRKVLAGSAKVHGKLHRLTIAAANNLALCLDELGHPGDAEPLYREALKGDELTLGAEHPSTLASINNLALCLKSQGKFAEAETLYRRALAGKEKVFGMSHPLTITAAHNLACCFHDQGKASSAEPLYRRSLESKVAHLGGSHPDVLRDVGNLALCLDLQGRSQESEALHWRAVEGKEKVLGAEHPSTLTAMANLALCLDELGKADQAAEVYYNCFTLRKKVLGSTSTSTLVSARHLVDFLERHHKINEANAIRRTFQVEVTECPATDNGCVQETTIMCGLQSSSCTQYQICGAGELPAQMSSGLVRVTSLPNQR